MELLERFLGHDQWTTACVLQLSQNLSDAELDRQFDIGHQTLRETFDHMIGNVEMWTDLIAERPVDRTPQVSAIATLIERHDRSYAEFAALARQLHADGRLDDTYVDTLDRPPTRKTFGGTIVHVITHNMHHRGEALHILQRLGVPNLPEGDALSWDSRREVTGDG